MTGSRSASGPGTGTATPPAGGPVLSEGLPTWRLKDRTLALGGPVVMGIVNLTPDSFSDGGTLKGLDAALSRAQRMVDEGAALLDVGGESTRPGADTVPVQEELDRVLLFVREAARALPVPISVDTRKAPVARAALEAGAAVVNDVSALRHDPDLGRVAADHGAGLVLMHMRGDPATMRRHTDYDDLVEDVARELDEAVERAQGAGVPDPAIVLDPGIGFAKTAPQSLTLLRDLPLLCRAGFPVLVGPSRKSFLGAVLDLPADQRLEGTLAACVAGYLGGARLFRVHDVGPAVRALAVAHAIRHPEVVS